MIKGGIFVLLLYIAMIIGWCMNVYKFTQCDFDPVNKTEIIRGVSIFVFPIGGVIGWFHIGEES